jgi:hypothetical protein
VNGRILPFAPVALVLLAGGLSGCKQPTSVVPDTGLPPGELIGVGLAPRDPIARVGEQVPFFATAYFDNTLYEDITDQVTWTSTNDRVASIGSDGVALALAEGETQIVVTESSGRSSQVTMTVLGEATTVESIQVEPPSLSLGVGDNAQLSVRATYSDGTTGAVGSGCAWSSDDPGIASVNASAIVAGVSAGTVDVGVICEDGLRSAASVTVVDDPVQLGEPDLQVSFAEGIAIGSDLVWYAEIRNNGDANAGGFYVDVILDAAAPPVPGDAFDATSYVSGLAPGAVAPVTLELLDVPPGTYSSWVAVDLDAFVAESDESNNTWGAIPLTIAPQADGPDLVNVEAFAFSDPVGLITEYAVEITNQGDVATQAFWLDLYTDQPGPPDVCAIGQRYVNVPSLAPGATYEWFPIVNDAAPFGAPWNSWVFVDSCDDVEESDETNNLIAFSPIE